MNKKQLTNYLQKVFLDNYAIALGIAQYDDEEQDRIDVQSYFDYVSGWLDAMMFIAKILEEGLSEEAEKVIPKAIIEASSAPEEDEV